MVLPRLRKASKFVNFTSHRQKAPQGQNATPPAAEQQSKADSAKAEQKATSIKLKVDCTGSIFIHRPILHG